MKRKNLFLLSFIVLMASCTSPEPRDSKEKHVSPIYTLIYQGHSPYVEWLNSDMEAFISYTLKLYPQDTGGQLCEHVRGTEDNTIVLKDNSRLRLHDKYKIVNEGKETKLELTRSYSLLPESSNAPKRLSANSQDNNYYTYYYSINTVFPLELISPAIDPNTPLPMCYYDGFKVNWTGDFTNDNGVIVIAEWNGVTMYDPAQDVSIINVDIVEDTGEAILNTHLFDEMPDEALVNLWLIKGNLLTITGVDINSGEHNITLEDFPDKRVVKTKGYTAAAYYYDTQGRVVQSRSVRSSDGYKMVTDNKYMFDGSIAQQLPAAGNYSLEIQSGSLTLVGVFEAE